MIDPNRQYRTRDGRAVRIYATDLSDAEGSVLGAVWHEGLNGVGWYCRFWGSDGTHPSQMLPDDSLVEVTLADEIRDQIPWSALRPEIRWVAMDVAGEWWGFQSEPERGRFAWDATTGDDEAWDLRAIAMPRPHGSRWRETLVQRPDDFAEAT